VIGVEWLEQHQPWLWAMAAASLVMFVATLLIVPALIVRMPHDYFARERRPWRPWGVRHPLLRLVIETGKTLLGLLLVTSGVLMLVLPGQGVVTILVGLTLMSFPGKYRLERWIVSRRPVRRVINWLRRRAGKRPLLLER
jgi:hypothetical protein